MLAFFLLTGLVLALLLFIAYAMPENTPENKLSWYVSVLVVVTMIAGILVGSFPPFAAIMRDYVWDQLVPTIVEVSPSSLAPPKAKKTGETIVVEESAPRTYSLQVSYLEPAAGNPHYEMVGNRSTFTVPVGATSVRVRWVSGNKVTDWADLP